jgi:hypothetical protein
MPVSGVTTGDVITEAWGDSVSAAVAAIEAKDTTQDGRLTVLEAVTPYVPGGTDVAIADGGTGASTAASARTNLGLGSTAAVTFSSVATPAVVFPATDVPSANVNTLDDYEEGTFTPALGFPTPGTSSWAVATAVGWYTKIGNRVLFHFVYIGTLTKGTVAATEVLTLSGLPFPGNAAASSGSRYVAEMQGWTKTGYTQVNGTTSLGATTGIFRLSGSGQALASITAAELAAGGQVTVIGSGSYIV